VTAQRIGNNILAESIRLADDGDGAADAGVRGGKPSRLFTLLDIVNHYCAGQLTWLLERIALFQKELAARKKQVGGGAAPKLNQSVAFHSLWKNAIDCTVAAGFTDALHDISRIHVPKPDAKEQPDLSTIIATLRSIQQSIYDDMKKRHFLSVAPDRVGFLEPLPNIPPFSKQPDIGYQEHIFWGNGKNYKIRSAIPDIKAAGNCLAAECPTAAVFHAMRATEHGIRALATRLKVVALTRRGKPQPIEFADWEAMIVAINTRVKAMAQMPRSARRQRRVAHYSDLADKCWYMKELWRNDLMHTRVTFNRSEAYGILQRVREFMQLVEKRV